MPTGSAATIEILALLRALLPSVGRHVPRPHVVRVALSADELELLEALARTIGSDRATTLRALIHHAML